jgi:hypothetical protein
LIHKRRRAKQADWDGVLGHEEDSDSAVC